MFVKIKGTGSCLPEKVLDNAAISQLVDTNDEWIQSRTGIKSRHIVGKETAVSMAAVAAEKALEDAGITAEEIDLLIVSSVSSEQLLPCTACSVQKKLGAVNAAAFDLNAACSGFIVAYQMAAGQIKAGLSKKALLIGVECLSNIVNWKDRGTCILFGDGAGAAAGHLYPGNLPLAAASDGLRRLKNEKHMKRLSSKNGEGRFCCDGERKG